MDGSKKTEQKMIPCLWFDNQAEEAVNFYVSIFDDSSIGTIARYGEAGHDIHGRKAGSVMTVDFELEGYGFTALNGGPHFKANPSISFFVMCKTEDKVDRLWDAFSDGGTPLMPLDKYPFSEKYGWIQDKYGLSWQLMVEKEKIDQKIVPSLLFVGEQAGNAEEAMNFYTGIFEDSKVGDIARYGAGQQPDEEGTIMHANFSLLGQQFAAMDSAQEHDFGFNEAISLIINCKTQDEIDHYWEKLSAHPESEQCGWLKDKFGVSWQVVPEIMGQLMEAEDPQKSERVMEAMLQMKKLDIAGLKEA